MEKTQRNGWITKKNKNIYIYINIFFEWEEKVVMKTISYIRQQMRD